MIFLAIILFLIIILLFILLELNQINKEIQKHARISPPGPRGLPLLGHLVFLGFNPHLTLMKWKQKYGPIIQCQFGSFPTVVLSDSKLIKEAFNMVEFAGRPLIPIMAESGFRKGMVCSEGPYHMELRQFTIKKLKEFGVGRKSLEDQIHAGILQLVDFIKQREGLSIKSEDVPSAHIIKTLWSIMMTDELSPTDVEQLNQIIHEINHLGPVLSEMAGFMPWLEKMTKIISFGRLSLISTRSAQMQKYTSWFSKPLEEKERKNGGKGQKHNGGQFHKPTDIMDFYLEKVKETTDRSSPFHASHNSAKSFISDMFGAGIHTIHTTLLWMLYFMARNREVQLKLQEEIDQVVENSRLPSLSDRGQMPYADAVVQEVLRLSSVVPLGVLHKATEDASFHDYGIDENTMIIANSYAVHHEPEIWGDPENFRPERWFGDSGRKLKSEHFLPFSTGRRICPGEALAREQLFLYVTTVFQKFSVGFHGNGRKNKVKAVFGIALHPSNFNLVFNQR